MGQGLVVDGGGGAADADGHQRFRAQGAIGPLPIQPGHMGFPLGDLLLLQQFHRREMGRKHFKALAQGAALLFAHGEHHLRGAEHTTVAFRLAEQGRVALDHFGRALHLEGLLKRVIGFDVAAVDRLAVAAGLGVHLGQLVVALHQGEVAQVGVAG